MKVFHAVLYTSCLWIIGLCLSVVYGFTHGDIDYQPTVKASPVAHEASQRVAADIFGVLDEGK